MIPAVAALGLQPTLVTTQLAFGSKEFNGHLSNCRHQFDLEMVQDSAALTESSPSKIKLQFDCFDQMIKRFKPDHILIPTAEQLMRAFFVGAICGQRFFFSRPIMEGMFFSPGFGYRFNSIRRRLTHPLLKWFSRRQPLDTYFHADPYQLAYIAKNQNAPDKYKVMPDPVPKPVEIDQQTARQKLGIPTDGRYVAICGGISASKGVDDLLNAFTLAMPKLRENDRMLLAGPFDSSMEKLVLERHKLLVDSGKIVCINRSMFGIEFDLTFQAIDLYCAVQRGRPGSSSTLLRAATAGRPILARDRFWSGRIVKHYDLGWVSETWNREAFAKSLLKCFDSLSAFEQNERSKRYLQFHTEQNFQAIWTAKLRTRMGMDGDNARIDWEDISTPSISNIRL